MQIQSKLIHTVPVFDVGDTLMNITQFFKDTTFSHVAITEGRRFLGIMAENDLETFDREKKIVDYRHNLEDFYALKETSWLDVLEIFTRNEANLIPVVDEERYVLGYYDLIDILGMLIETPFFNEPGGVLVIEKGGKDHSFSEIAQIVESNNMKLLGAFITSSQNDVVQTTIKLNSERLNEVVQTFRRYNYNILFGNTDDQFLEDLRQRSDYLDKYLNV